jgi:hypothetical protein
LFKFRKGKKYKEKTAKRGERESAWAAAHWPPRCARGVRHFGMRRFKRGTGVPLLGRFTLKEFLTVPNPAHLIGIAFYINLKISLNKYNELYIY